MHDPSLLAEQGYAFFRNHHLEAARLRFDQLMRYWPDDADVMRTRGQVLLHMGEENEAERMMTLAVSLRPEDPQTWADLANFHLHFNRFEEARKIVEQAKNRHLAHRSLIAAANECERAGADIEKTFDVFISYKSEDVALARHLAEHYLASGKRVWFAEYAIRLDERDSFNSLIYQGIRQSRWAIAITNRKYGHSIHCRHELRHLLDELGPQRILQVACPDETIDHPDFPTPDVVPDENRFACDDLGDLESIISWIGSRVTDLQCELPDKAAPTISPIVPSSHQVPGVFDRSICEDVRSQVEQWRHSPTKSAVWAVETELSSRLPRVAPSARNGILDRFCFDQLTHLAKEQSVGSDADCCGVHLMFQAGLSHHAITWKWPNYCERRYTFVFPSDQIGNSRVFHCTFLVPCDLAQFWRHAREMDRLVDRNWQDFEALASERERLQEAELDQADLSASRAPTHSLRKHREDLGNFNALDEKIRALLVVLNGDRWSDRKNALLSLSNLIDALRNPHLVIEVRDACLSSLQHPDAGARRQSVLLLGRLPALPQHQSPVLLNLLLDQDDEVRLLAIQEFIRTHHLSPEIIPKLDIGLVDTVAEVRLWTALVLSTFHVQTSQPATPELTKVLLTLLVDEDLESWRERLMSEIRLLGTLIAPQIESLSEADTGNDGFDSQLIGAAVLAHAVLPDRDKAIERLIRFLDHDALKLRCRACEALGEMSPVNDDVHERLKRFYEDSTDFQSRESARLTLLRMQPWWTRILARILPQHFG